VEAVTHRCARASSCMYLLQDWTERQARRPRAGFGYTARHGGRGARGGGARQVADDVGVVQVLEHVDLRLQAAHVAHHAPRHRLVLADQHLRGPLPGSGFLLEGSHVRGGPPRCGRGMGAAAVHVHTGGRHCERSLVQASPGCPRAPLAWGTCGDWCTSACGCMNSRLAVKSLTCVCCLLFCFKIKIKARALKKSKLVIPYYFSAAVLTRCCTPCSRIWAKAGAPSRPQLH